MTQSGETCSYTYDDVGNIASVVQNNKTTAYTYDALGQLIRVDDENDTTSGTAGTTWTYEYDRGGNILAKKRYAYTTGTLGTALETVTYTYDTTWKDKLINYNGITIEYDAIGNPTKAGTKTGEVWDPDTWHYTWARGRQLQVMYKGSFGQPGYDEIAFTYNHEGLRTRKTRMYYSDGDVAYSSTEYTLHGKNIVHMTQGSDSLHFFYAPRFSLAGSAGFGLHPKDCTPSASLRSALLRRAESASNCGMEQRRHCRELCLHSKFTR